MNNIKFISIFSGVCLLSILTFFGIKKNHKPQTNPFLEERIVEIDSALQTIVQEELEAEMPECDSEWGTVLLMETKTGIIRALYGVPDSCSMLSNEMGSIMMPITVLAAMQSPDFVYDSVFVNKEGYKYHDCTFTDPHRKTALYSIENAIAISSRAAVAQMIIRACQKDIKSYFDFLSNVGINVKDSDTDSMRLAIHSALGYKYKISPAQIAYIYSCIATGQNLPVTEKSLATIRRALHDVVWDNDFGSASVSKWIDLNLIVRYKAQSEIVHIAGKTGVSLIYRDGKYQPNEVRISFVGYFPEEDPQYTCIVILNKPKLSKHPDAGYDCGGTVRRIAERILNK